MDVYKYVIEIAKAEKVKGKDLTLLKVAVLLHDAGFTKSYKGHEDLGCQMAREILPDYGFTSEDIQRVQGMIMATKIPQQPHNLLEEILADADLLYLGTHRFKEVGDTLFEEMKIYADLQSEKQWNVIQKSFLEKHHFHTQYCKTKYEPAKQKNLKKILKVIEKGH